MGVDVSNTIMSQLKRFESTDGIELVINTITGEAFATERGYARMSGLSQQAINKRTNNQQGIKKAQIPSVTGLKTNNLIPAKLVFKWLIKDNPNLAEKMGEVGATVYLHQIAGYKIKSTATEPKLPTHSPQPVTDHTISEYRLLMELLSEDGDDRMKHLVKNHLAYRLQAEQAKVLPGGVEITQLEGVVDVAIRLGYSVTGADESPLGRYVAKRCRHLIQGKSVRYSLRTGVQIKPNMYPEYNAKVEQAVREYFQNKLNEPKQIQFELPFVYPED